MKIAITCPASLPATQFGGIMFLAINIAKKLSQKGNQVTIYTTDLDFANNSSTFNKKLPKIDKIDQFLIKRTHVFFSIYLFFINLGMYNQMKKDEFDLIHAIGVRSFQSIIAALISRKKNIPLIISDQGGLTTHPDLESSSLLKVLLLEIQKPIIKFIINQADKIIVPNEYEKKIFLKFCDSKKISIVKNGIDLDELQKSKINFSKKFSINKEFILFLGRFHKVKGIDTLLEAINLIKNDSILKDITIVIMGVDFGFQSEMEKMIKELSLEKNIIVIKKPAREDVISAYHECKFLILPSRWELSPLTPLEGFACRKTVISTTAHGIPFTITHNQNCILVSPGKPHELTKSIIDLLNNPNKCKILGQAGYDMIIKESNIDTMVNGIFSIYKKTIQLKNHNKMYN